MSLWICLNILSVCCVYPSSLVDFGLVQTSRIASWDTKLGVFNQLIQADILVTQGCLQTDEFGDSGSTSRPIWTDFHERRLGERTELLDQE